MAKEFDVELLNSLNAVIKSGQLDTNLISDGYHTFGELYEHRLELFIALCKIINSTDYLEHQPSPVWKSKLHSDGSSFDGWFILGIGTSQGNQITYHLPMSKWEQTDFAPEWEVAPEFDGHTSKDVLERLKNI